MGARVRGDEGVTRTVPTANNKKYVKGNKRKTTQKLNYYLYSSFNVTHVITAISSITWNVRLRGCGYSWFKKMRKIRFEDERNIMKRICV